MIVSLTEGPVHPFKEGVIIYITYPVPALLLIKVCDGIVAELPEAIKPVMPSGEEPVQENCVPKTLPERETAFVAALLQTVWFRLAFVTSGTGLTVIFTVEEAAGQTAEGALVVSVATAIPEVMEGVK